MPASTPRLRGLSVLLVDPDEDDLDLLGSLLTQAGADVTAVSSVEAALRALGSRVHDVVVSELVMKGHDGFTLIRRIRRLPREKGRDVPCIAMSAYVGTKRLRDQVLAAGYTHFLAKPVHDRIVDTLAALVTQPTRA
jgi:CheY-like chemotaxis protein